MLKLFRPASIGGIALACACTYLACFACIATATELVPDGFYWYVPEHEKYARTEFFSQPSFRSATVRFARTQRFQFEGVNRGWALLRFDGETQAFIHLRILRTLLWDAAASDPWYEFKRASVFPEEPEKIEARLKSPHAEPRTVDSKLPIWKRYKEGWGINKGREKSGAADDNTDALPARTPEKKRNKYPLLPPIGAPPSGNAEETPPNGSSAR